MSPKREADERRHSMLRTALGPDIAAALDDPTVNEVMVNPDGMLRLERAGQGIVTTGMQVPPEEVERLIRLAAKWTAIVASLSCRSISLKPMRTPSHRRGI